MIRASLSISCIKTNRLESRSIDVPRLSLPHTLCNTYIISEVIIFLHWNLQIKNLNLKIIQSTIFVDLIKCRSHDIVMLNILNFLGFMLILDIDWNEMDKS